MAADSANIGLIDISRLLVRSGVIAALLSTQTPAASDHSINHEPPAMDQRRQAMVGLAVASLRLPDPSSIRGGGTHVRYGVWRACCTRIS
jgi:hypothetical protein